MSLFEPESASAASESLSESLRVEVECMARAQGDLNRS